METAFTLEKTPKNTSNQKHTKACLTFAKTKVDFERLIPIATSVTNKKNIKHTVKHGGGSVVVVLWSKKS